MVTSQLVEEPSVARPAAGGQHGYFAALAPARFAQLTAIGPDGTLVSAVVQIAVDGNRAYALSWSRPLRRGPRWQAGWVQVAPCSALGLFRYDRPVDATARRLPGRQAGRAAGRLAAASPGRTASLLGRARRLSGARPEYYQLTAPGLAVTRVPQLTRPAARVSLLVSPPGPYRRGVGAARAGGPARLPETDRELVAARR